MISAFGIDHGDYEVEKAFGMGALRTFGGALARKTTQAGGALSSRGANFAAKARSAPGAATFGRSARVSAGGAAGKVGGQLKKLGGQMAARPGVAGGAALGGAGVAGVGAAGGAFGNRKRF